MSYTEKNYDFSDNLTPAQKVFSFIWDLLKVVVVSLLIILPVRYFLIQPFYVKGASMEPSFFDHEYLIIDEISYGIRIPFSGGRVLALGDPERGDMIVFRYPKDPSQYFIKRVIGLPGEKIEIKDNQIFIIPQDGKKFIINELEYLSDSVETRGNKSWTLGEGEYYVMGDNREYSFDSRGFGPVYRDLIVGKVWLRGWPIWRAAVFSEVKYE